MRTPIIRSEAEAKYEQLMLVHPDVRSALTENVRSMSNEVLEHTLNQLHAEMWVGHAPKNYEIVAQAADPELGPDRAVVRRDLQYTVLATLDGVAKERSLWPLLSISMIEVEYVLTTGKSLAWFCGGDVLLQRVHSETIEIDKVLMVKERQ